MIIQIRSLSIAAILCISVPLASSLLGQEGSGPDGPRLSGPRRGGPDRNGPGRNAQEGPRRGGPDRNGPGRNAQEGPRRGGPQQKGPRRDGPQQKGPDRKGSQQKGPQQNGPQQNGPDRNASPRDRSGARDDGFSGRNFRSPEGRKPTGPGFGRPDAKSFKANGNAGSPRMPAPRGSRVHGQESRDSEHSKNRGNDHKMGKGSPGRGSMNRGSMNRGIMNRGSMNRGMPQAKFGQRGSKRRQFTMRGMQHRGASRGRLRGRNSRFGKVRSGRSMQRFAGRSGFGSFRGMQHRGMQHRGMQHRGMQHRGKSRFQPNRSHRGQSRSSMSRRFSRGQGFNRMRGMQHRGAQRRGVQQRGMMPYRAPSFRKGPSNLAMKSPRQGNGPEGMNRNRMGRPSGFGDRGQNRYDGRSANFRGNQPRTSNRPGDGRGNDDARGSGKENRPADQDQRMERMNQFFGSQFGNRGPMGPNRGPRENQDRDGRTGRNIRPGFPERGPTSERSFDPARTPNRGGDSRANRDSDRRDVRQDRPDARASRENERTIVRERDARSDRSSIDRLPERKPQEKNRRVEVEINGDSGTITLKGSAEDVRHFQQLLERANSADKTELNEKADRSKPKTSGSRRLPSKSSGKKPSKAVGPSKTAPESDLWKYV